MWYYPQIYHKTALRDAGDTMALGYLVNEDLFFLSGEIKHWDLVVRNACGFISLDDAGAIAKQYGYKLSWEN
jgi:hypothetical protein